MSIDEVDPERKLGLTASGRKEFVELRRRRRVLDMKPEILERARVCVARESVLKQ